jgi:hypothetical protein
MKYLKSEPTLSLAITIELKDTYLDLNYYKLSVVWSDNDNWIGSIRKNTEGNCITLSSYDLLLHIMNIADDCLLKSISIKVINDNKLKDSLLVLTNAKEGSKINAARELAYNHKEVSRISQFFRSNNLISAN